MVILETPRLIMRPLRESDAAALSAYRSDPLVARYQNWTTPYTLEQARAFIATASSQEQVGEWCQLALERKTVAGIIGDCAFRRWSCDKQQAEIAFTLAREWQHQGYANEAVGRLLEYLFAELGLHRVTARCDDENYPSINVLERLGLRREGHPIENVWLKGAWGSEYEYAMLEREWWARQKGIRDD